jgi:indole-3-glycerol phosphate synthase
MSGLLEAFVGAARRAAAERARLEPADALEARALAMPARVEAFRSALAGRPNSIRVIAECKRRSPSRGILARDYAADVVAAAYERAGAAAVSVLTEPTFFDGSLDDLARVRRAVGIPILRKDFIVDDYQLLEARAMGADAILLIVAAIDRSALRGLIGRAGALGLDVLCEAHEPDEVRVAADAGARIVGVNSRNLRTLEVSFDVFERAAASLPQDVVAVAESGIKSRGDIDRLRALGYSAFLIGERFMTMPDPGAALAAFLSGPGAEAPGLQPQWSPGSQRSPGSKWSPGSSDPGKDR